MSTVHDPAPDPQAVEQERQRLSRRLDEVARLCEGDVPPATFYGELLRRLLESLAATAGIVWLRNAQGNLQILFQINSKEVGLDRSEEARRSHDELLRRAVVRPQALHFPPHSGAGPCGWPSVTSSTAAVVPGRACATAMPSKIAPPRAGYTGVVTPSGEQYGALTTPDPVELHRIVDRLADDGITHLAIEASSHGLDQHRLDGLRVSIASFTNISRDHLDYHGTPEAYLQAKLILFRDLVAAAAAHVPTRGFGLSRSIALR